jgi:hypothetical protein
MSFRLVYVGAASLLCLFASASLAAEPTRRESAIAAAAAQGRLEELRPDHAPLPRPLRLVASATIRAGERGEELAIVLERVSSRCSDL